MVVVKRSGCAINCPGVLSLQRSKETGIWELPQGGLIGDESEPDAGVHHNVHAEKCAPCGTAG